MKSASAHNNSLKMGSNIIQQSVPSFTDSIKGYVVETYDINNLASQPEELRTDKSARRKINKFLAENTNKVVPLLWRGRPDRPVGRCYLNAYMEFLATGNPMAYGYKEGSALVNDYFVSFIPHAFNYDKATGQYYDTTYFLQDASRETKPVFLITDKVKALYSQDITSKLLTPSIDKTYGGYMFLTYGDKTYALHGKEHTDWEEPCPAKWFKYQKAEFLTAL
jgi:hypothetical protein